MEGTEGPETSADFIPGRLMVRFKSIMARKSRTELLRSIGAAVEGTSEDGRTVIARIPEGTEQDALGILDRAPGVESASRVVRGQPLAHDPSGD